MGFSPLLLELDDLVFSGVVPNEVFTAGRAIDDAIELFDVVPEQEFDSLAIGIARKAGDGGRHVVGTAAVDEVDAVGFFAPFFEDAFVAKAGSDLGDDLFGRKAGDRLAVLRSEGFGDAGGHHGACIVAETAEHAFQEVGVSRRHVLGSFFGGEVDVIGAAGGLFHGPDIEQPISTEVIEVAADCGVGNAEFGREVFYANLALFDDELQDAFPGALHAASVRPVVSFFYFYVSKVANGLFGSFYSWDWGAPNGWPSTLRPVAPRFRFRIPGYP